MIIILVHSHFDKAHLAEVVEKMKTMGTPTIKVWDYEDGFGTYQAIEGCHRLRACEILEIVPNIIVLDKGKVVEEGTHDNLIQKSGLYRKLYETQFDIKERV